MRLTGAGRIAGVAGWPVAQALSPLLFGYWLEQYAVNGAQVPLAVRPQDFSRVMDALRRAGFRGCSVTVPHKEAAFAIAHETDETARAAGAANLLLFGDDGRILARNTDGDGLAASLVEGLGADFLKGGKAVMVGAGGAARAALVALSRLGAREIVIVNRSPARAQALVDALSGGVQPALRAQGFEDWARAADGAALMLNAGSAGMMGKAPLALPLDVLPAGAAVCDIVHTPLDTDLLQRARARGLRTVDGLGMLMHQGVPHFEAFFGVRPAVTPALRAALIAARNHD